MPLVQQERKALADMLRRFVRSDDEYGKDDKEYLLRLIDRFEKQGSSSLIDAEDQDSFTDLIHYATC